MNWIRIGLSDEQLDYVIRKFLDNLIEEEKLANTRSLVEQKEHSDVAKEMWSGGKKIEPHKGESVDMGTDLVIGHDTDYSNDTSTPFGCIKDMSANRVSKLNKTRKLLKQKAKTKKRDKNGRFISNKRKRRT